MNFLKTSKKSKTDFQLFWYKSVKHVLYGNLKQCLKVEL